MSCTATKNFLRSSGATILARAIQVVAFKRCCLKSGRFDGSKRNYFFPRITPGYPTHGSIIAMDGVRHPRNVQQFRMTRRLLCSLILALAAPALLAQSPASLTPDQQLAHDIFKQFIEIKSVYTTGATTPVAEAAAARLRAAGFPDSDIFIGGPIPTK